MLSMKEDAGYIK